MARGHEPDRVLRERINAARPEIVKVIHECGVILEAAVRKQAGLQDHTLKDLRKLGHPYRMRQGGFYRITKSGKWTAGIKAKARTIREGDLGHDIKLVHIQSGDLLAQVELIDSDSGDVVGSRVNLDEGGVPYVRWLVTGTRKMIPRDFIGIAAIRARPLVFQALRLGLRQALFSRGGA